MSQAKSGAARHIPGARTTWMLMGAVVTFACSIHSLDYLDSGRDAGPASGGAGAAGDSAENAAGFSGASLEVPDCTDSQATADETDVDCGGRTCAPCTDGKRCLDGPDCESAICTNRRCQKASCNDLVVNGDETDLNCGGECPKCALGTHCQVNADCDSETCEDAVCVSPTCVDDRLSDACPLLVDNTPYSLSPAHALDKCVDDNGQSVAEGNGMILFGCKLELQQTFWAVAQSDGYFAFRSALSGKCLQVHGSSAVEGAAIEQGACDYAPAQLWKPSRVDDSFMQLTNKRSALLLDVAGSNLARDFQSIVQSKGTDSADMRWRLLRRAAAAYVALTPNDAELSHVHHSDREVTLSDADEPSAHWKVVPGLGDASLVSFQSRDEPGRYLRHAGFRIWADLNDGTPLFAYDATFGYAKPFVGGAPLSHALEALNYPGRFWRLSGDVIAVSKQDGTSAFNSEATWWLSGR